ncbi:hypothetical protein EV122DRAFT_282723 [Schizophyllum commune]
MAALGAFAGAYTHLESIVLSFDANMDVSYAPRVAERLATLLPSLTWVEDDYDDGRYEESQADWVAADAAMRARARAQRAKVWTARRSAFDFAIEDNNLDQRGDVLLRRPPRTL